MQLPMMSEMLYPLTDPLVALSIAFAFWIFLLWRRSRCDKYARHQGLPFPGVPLVPSRHWFFGHLKVPADADLLTRQRVQSVDHADASTGLCSFYMFRKPILSVLKGSHAQKILRSTPYKRPFFKRLAEKALGGRYNIALMNGREWRIHRAPASRAMQSEAALRIARRHIVAVGDTLVQSILCRIGAANKERVSSGDEESLLFEVSPLMKMATIDVFGASALGRDLGCCRALKPSPVVKAFEYIMDDLQRRMKSPLSPSTHLFFLPTAENLRMAKESQVLRSFLTETVMEHMNRVNGKVGDSGRDGSSKADVEMEDWDLNRNLLAQIIAINASTTTAESDRLDVSAIVDSLVVLLFAGFDTTSNALCFALNAIACDPGVEERCVAEAMRVLGDCQCSGKGGTFLKDDFDVVDKLPYCHAVLMESLRLYPPGVRVLRELERPLVLDGITVPQGTTVVVPIYSIHRDARNFPRPLEFLPERWVRLNEETWVERRLVDEENTNEAELPPMADCEAFLTFSSGARSCLGRRFAVQEGTLLLAVLIKSLKFKLQDGYEMKPGHSGIIMGPDDDLPLIISKRD